MDAGRSVDQLQWPAMTVAVLAAWLAASRTPQASGQVPAASESSLRGACRDMKVHAKGYTLFCGRGFSVRREALRPFAL